MKISERLFFFALILLLFYSSSKAVWASEAGSSHYTPGAMASFIDFPTGIPYNVLSPFLGYFGSASVSRQFPIAGLLTADVDANIFAWTPTFQYDLPNKVLGGHYAFTLSIPVMTMEVNASVSGPQGLGIRRSDSSAGLGDIYFSPFILFWKKGNFSYLTSLGIYAPSGSFHVGQLANLGRNYWTFAPTGAMFYNNPKNGLEATAFTGFNFNTENNATHYQSGQEFFMDFTISKRFKSGFGVGGTGYIFQQITGDSGSGALLGSFRGRTFGLGPEVSYMAPVDKYTLIAVELKWLPEIEVQNRLQGNWVWLKIGFVWPLPQIPPPPKTPEQP